MSNSNKIDTSIKDARSVLSRILSKMRSLPFAWHQYGIAPPSLEFDVKEPVQVSEQYIRWPSKEYVEGKKAWNKAVRFLGGLPATRPYPLSTDSPIYLQINSLELMINSLPSRFVLFGMPLWPLPLGIGMWWFYARTKKRRKK